MSILVKSVGDPKLGDVQVCIEQNQNLGAFQEMEDIIRKKKKRVQGATSENDFMQK